MIEYKNKFMKNIYLIYEYEGNHIIRYKVDKESKTIHQVLFDIHNKDKEIQYIYAEEYKKLIMYELKKDRVIMHGCRKAIGDEINISFFRKVKVKFDDCLNKPNKLETMIYNIKNECIAIYTNDFWKNVFQFDIEENDLKKMGK